MQSNRRLGVGVAVAALAVAIALFLVLREDDSETTSPASADEQTTAEPTAAGDKGGPKPDKPDEPEQETIVFRDGEVVGGVAELSFEKGERIRFAVESDVADHVHLHGYDVFQDVPAGGRATFDVLASLDGVFEVELEDRVIPLAEITVEP
jgi:hypothetical protein